MIQYGITDRAVAARWLGGTMRVALMALAFCASAFANPSKNTAVTPKASATKAQTEAQRLVFKKKRYMFVTSSCIPQPIGWVAVPIATTMVPMSVLGGPPFGVKQPRNPAE